MGRFIMKEKYVYSWQDAHSLTPPLVKYQFEEKCGRRQVTPPLPLFNVEMSSFPLNDNKEQQP